MTSALLLDEPCLVIQPALVRTLGHLADAAVLQQIHYWLQRATARHAGERWVYKTYEQWSDEIGITEKQARASITRLEAAGILISCQPEAYHRRKWYRIDYECPILTDRPSAHTGASICPDGRMDLPSRADGSALVGASITEITSEITTEITTEKKRPSSTKSNEIVIVDPDVEARLNECHRLGDLLADLIADNGARRPKVSKAWITTLDRMIRIDERSPDQIENAIRWAMAHTFWSTNILSPDALRRHYERMRLQAMRDQQSAGPRGLSGVRDFLASLEDQPR